MYEGMLFGGDWRTVMTAIGTRLNAPMIGFRVSTGTGQWTVSLGYPKEYEDLYDRHYHRVDLMQERTCGLPPMQPVLMSYLSHDPAALRSEHYRDVIGPLRVEHILTARCVSDACSIILAAGRLIDEPPFDADEVDAFTAFAQTLDSARRLRERFGARLGDPQTPEASVLRRRFDLTRRQAEVAVEVARGLSVDAIGARIGVGREAVRAHLKEIYRKTETHARAALVHRLLTQSKAEDAVT